MNTEYVIDSVIDILQNNLEAMLLVVEGETDSSLSTPTPQEYFFGDRDPTVLTLFPAVIVKGDFSYKKDDQYGYQERTTTLNIITWAVNEDEENLHRIILRYGDAIGRVLRDESNWPPNLHSPRVENTQYSDLYQSDFGLAEGCLNKIDISYVIS